MATIDRVERLLEDVLDRAAILGHSLIVGADGAGKTSIVEDFTRIAAAMGFRCVCLDTEGDLARLARHRGSGAEEAMRLDFSSTADFISTPPIGYEDEDDHELVVDTVAALLQLLGYRRRRGAPEFALAEAVIADAWQRGEGLSISGLAARLRSPEIESIGVFPLDEVISRERRDDLASAIQSKWPVLTGSAQRGLVAELTNRIFESESKSGVTVIDISQLSPGGRQFAAAITMARLKAGRELSAPAGGLVIVFDQGEQFLPREGSTIVEHLIHEALDSWSMHDIGIVFVVDAVDGVDEIAEDLCHTWIVGTTPSPSKRRAIVEALDLVDPPVDSNELEESIRGLTKGHFLFRPSGAASVRSISGPM